MSEAMTEESQQSYDDQCFEAEEEDDQHVSTCPPDVVLSAIDVAQEQAAQIDQLVALFGVTRLAASTLLRTYKWKVERLIEAYYWTPLLTSSII